METNVALVIPKNEDDEFEVHSGCRNATAAQKRVADVLGISSNKITSRVKRVGGSFGGKKAKGLYVSAALAVGAWTGQRHPFLGKWNVGLTKDGKILVYDLKYYLICEGTSDVTIIVALSDLLAADGCYYIPNIRLIGNPCKTNVHSNTAFRGFGQPQAVFILESMLSELSLVKETSEFEKRKKEVEEFNSNNNWHKRGLALLPIEFGVSFPVALMNHAGA
ncbi:4469_t:CDS:2 [Dentiscutata erythropus]|uniref:4469_t:CDS:1 n=1 Tax=Dentiscutata erythropus TaxID=1348616 RepID=A0A9N9H4E9_9GLOM|nr:4469_t:CDS:2 [Dentiscutata erythropus]